MNANGLCFVVCDGCGPVGLYEQLKARMRSIRGLQQSVDVRQAPCLMACRFKQVVKVIDGEGHVVDSYSSVTRNGFRALHDDPVQQMVDDHVDARTRSSNKLVAVGAGESDPPAKRGKSR